LQINTENKLNLTLRGYFFYKKKRRNASCVALDCD
jgi:hypothetical protein